MAAAIFRGICKRNKQTGVIVRSAGTHANEGQDMNAFSKNALIECGEKLPSSEHKAKQFTDKMKKQYDYIIDLNNAIPDPYGYGQGAYNSTCRKLQIELSLLYKEIFK